MENLKELIEKVDRIKESGWIQSTARGCGGVGLTFEHALNIEQNEFEIPDYLGEIEIKTKTINSGKSKYPFITLFSAVPDSYLFEIKRIHETYGYPYGPDPSLKVFNVSVFANRKKSMSGKYDFQLDVDRERRQVILCVYNKRGELIDDKTSWSFEMLEEKLNRKLKYLLYVKALRKFEHGQVFFKYVKSTFYLLKDFDNFINAIEKGYIRVNFKIGVYNRGIKYGQLKDRGTGFDIDENYLEELFLTVK